MWHRFDECAIGKHLDDCHFLIGLDDCFLKFAVCADFLFVEAGQNVLPLGVEKVVEVCIVGIDVEYGAKLPALDSYDFGFAPIVGVELPTDNDLLRR